MSHLLSPIGSPSSCYDFDTTQFAVIMPNNELNTDIDSIPYPLSLQPIIMDPITTLNIENPVPLPTSISSSLPLLQTSSARSFSSSSDTATKSTVKRRSQVKNACVNCQKACKKCDDGRPCQRCIKLGITDTCVDSPRKERKKGFKRGPYKKKSAQLTALKIEKADTTKYTIKVNPSSQLQSPIVYSSSTDCTIQPSQLDNALIAQNRFNLYYNNIRSDNRDIMIENTTDSVQCMKTQLCELNTLYNELHHASYHHSAHNNHNATTKSPFYYADSSALYDHNDYYKPKIASIMSLETESHYYANATEREQQQQYYLKNDVYPHTNFANATNSNDIRVNNNTWNFHSAQYYDTDIL